MSQRRISMALMLTIIAALLLAIPAGAEDVYSERTMDLAARLQCPVCSGQAVADSQVTLARQMRDVIEQKVQAGESDEEIIAYFTARYGDNVLLEPSRGGLNIALWWIPPVVLAIGALAVALYMREGTGRSRQAATASGDRVDTGDEELEALAREYLRPDADARRS